jgi:hypothetical protein
MKERFASKKAVHLSGRSFQNRSFQNPGQNAFLTAAPENESIFAKAVFGKILLQMSPPGPSAASSGLSFPLA